MLTARCRLSSWNGMAGRCDHPRNTHPDINPHTPPQTSAQTTDTPDTPSHPYKPDSSNGKSHTFHYSHTSPSDILSHMCSSGASGSQPSIIDRSRRRNLHSGWSRAGIMGLGGRCRLGRTRRIGWRRGGRGRGISCSRLRCSLGSLKGRLRIGCWSSRCLLGTQSCRFHQRQHSSASTLHSHWHYNSYNYYHNPHTPVPSQAPSNTSWPDTPHSTSPDTTPSRHHTPHTSNSHKPYTHSHTPHISSQADSCPPGTNPNTVSYHIVISVRDSYSSLSSSYSLCSAAGSSSSLLSRLGRCRAGRWLCRCRGPAGECSLDGRLGSRRGRRYSRWYCRAGIGCC